MIPIIFGGLGLTLNRGENQIHLIAIGRKDCIFAGYEKAAQNADHLYNLLAADYLRDT